MSKINDDKNIKFQRIWAMPNKNTFEILPIKKTIIGRSRFKKLLD